MSARAWYAVGVFQIVAWGWIVLPWDAGPAIHVPAEIVGAYLFAVVAAVVAAVRHIMGVLRA